MRGRPKKPTALKLIAGTWNPSRANPGEPKPGVARLEPPEALGGLAREYFERLSLTLHEMRVLTEADGEGLAALANALADCRIARASLAREVRDERGRVVAPAGSVTYVTEGKSGPMVRPRPELAMIADADRRVAMWLSRFGLTPADRPRVSSAPGEERSPWDALFPGAS